MAMRMKPYLGAALAALAWLAGACADVSGPTETIAQGMWGGDGIEMTVTASGATIDFGCDAGTIDEPLIASDNGRFSVRGTYSFGIGGPRAAGEAARVHAARYEGTSDGRRMTLNISLPDLSRSAGQFRLELARHGSLERCL